MGRDALRHSVRDEIFEEILSRRENETDPPWPRKDWDYTEWEEALQELKERTNRIDVV